MFIMFKGKLFLKSVIACGLAIAMLISMALPVFADDVAVDDIAVVKEPALEEPAESPDPAPDAPVNTPAAPAIPAVVDILRRKPVEVDSADMENQMKKALATAKTYIEIDEKIYTDFSYNVYESDGKTNWSFNWNSSDNNSYIYISVVDEKLTSYNKYKYSVDGTVFAFAKVTKAEAESKAAEFLKKIQSKDADKFKIQSSSIYYSSDSYNISLVEYKGDYLNSAGNSVSIGIDKLTGEVTSYYNNNYYGLENKEFVYQDSSKIITSEKAVKAYIEKIGLDLVYSHYYDYSTKTSNVFPVYRPKYYGNQYISAVTGEVIDISNSSNSIIAYGYGSSALLRLQSLSYDKAAGVYMAEDSSSAVSYSDVEVSELEKIKNYITREKALEISLDIFKLSAEDMKNYTQYASLSKGYINQNQYVWNINFYSEDTSRYYGGYYNISIDARNGNVISYSRYNYAAPVTRPVGVEETEEDVAKGYKYTYEEAKKIALAEINKLSSYSIDNFELVEYSNSIPKEKASSYNFTWYRKVNGYLFDSNYITVSIDNTTGEINAYNIAWYEDIAFPEIKKDNILSQAEAFAKILEYAEFIPVYAETEYNEEKNISKLSLVYMLDVYSITIDPFTGDYLNYMGKADSSELEPDYDDVVGHWSEKVVTTLVDNGIYVWGGKFEPEKAITTSEFITFIQFFTNINYRYYTSYEKLQKYITDDNNKASDEKSNATLTRQEAAKIICELLGYDRLMNKPEYLLYPFKGGNVNEEYKGYITLCHMLGIIEGSGGTYNATEILTRAEAAQLLYNLLTK